MTDHEKGTPDRFEQWLAREARSLDAPPPTPREEMWTVIAAATAASGGAQGGNAIAPVREGRFGGRRWIMPAAIAAALLLGVAIDRVVMTRGGTTTPAAPVTVAERPATIAPETTATSPDAANPTPDSPVAPRAVSRRPASPRPGSPRPASPRPASPRPYTPRREATDLYRLATVQMLAQAEVVLTTYRASEDHPADAASMQRIGLWAKDVLSSTRLLIDSPVGSDARMRPLLDDLELVLVQLVRLSGAPLTDVERAAIDRTLRERDLLPRIRTAVPSGTSVPTV